jgi:hypothetical protein
MQEKADADRKPDQAKAKANQVDFLAKMEARMDANQAKTAKQEKCRLI